MTWITLLITFCSGAAFKTPDAAQACLKKTTSCATHRILAATTVDQDDAVLIAEECAEQVSL